MRIHAQMEPHGRIPVPRDDIREVAQERRDAPASSLSMSDSQDAEYGETTTWAR